MNKRLLVVGYWLIPALALAQGGQNAAILLELPASARALAMGSAYVAVGGDDASIFYNPAQLATSNRTSAGLSLQRYIESSTLGAVSAATQLGPGTIGVGIQYLNYGSEDEFIPDPASGGETGQPTGGSISASDLAASVGYGMMWRGARVGATAKYVRQSVAGASGGTGALDLGAAMDVWYGATIGISVQNLGGNVGIAGSSAPLPRLVRIGASLPWRGLGPFDVLGTLELAHTRGGDTSPAGGAEMRWTSANGLAFLVRAGALARSENAATSQYSFGGGVRAQSIAVDYAYQGFDALETSTHRLGVRWWR